MSASKRYAVVGTGLRSMMYLDAITDTFAGSAQLVGLCDVSETRMDWHNRRLHDKSGIAPIPTFTAANQSIATQQMVSIDSLVRLPDPRTAQP